MQEKEKSDYTLWKFLPSKNFSFVYSCFFISIQNMPPKIHRKKPFSGKQKKQQLQEKHAKKAEKGFLNVNSRFNT